MIFQVALTIFLLACLALVLLFWVGKKKSLRFLAALVFTVLFLLLIITPLIMSGDNPVLVTILAAIPIAAIIIYLTEGFTVLAHLSVIITLVIFFITALVADCSVWLAHFIGIISEAATTVGGQLGISLPSLLTAGIMLGTLGILVEMTVTQVATVIELARINPQADREQVFKKSFNIGIIHVGSIINTLFLIYAGVALPLLIVFLYSGSSWYAVLGYEPVSTEIIRTLVSTIGLIIAMPVSTYIAVQWIKKEGNSKAF